MLVDAEVAVAYVVLAARRPEVGRSLAVRLEGLVRALSWRLGADVVTAAGTEDDEAVARLVAWVDAVAVQDPAFAESLAQLQFELDARGGRALLGEERRAPSGEEAALATDLFIARADLARAFPEPVSQPVSQPVAPPVASPVAPPRTVAPQRVTRSWARLVYGLGIALCLAGMVPVVLTFTSGAAQEQPGGFSTAVTAGFVVFVLGFVTAIGAAVRIAGAEQASPATRAATRAAARPVAQPATRPDARPVAQPGFGYAGQRDTHPAGV